MKKFNAIMMAACLLAMMSCNNAEKAPESTPPVSDSTTAPAAEATPETPPMDSAATAKAWENFMTPGAMHQWMAAMDGKWEGESTSWMGPDAPPSPSTKIKAENKMVLGGRYQESTYKGDMMGMPFEGKSLMAYDNVKKKFINTWIDNMGTGIVVMEGLDDENSKSITLTGKMTDPATGKDIQMRQVLRNPDDKTSVMEMYCMQGGKEYKNMEIKLAKK